MYKLSKTGQDKLNTCHADIQTIITKLLEVYDITVVEGTRTQEQQMQYFKEGKSRLDGITKKSKHQSLPSMAIDIIPCKEGTNAFSGKVTDNYRFFYMSGLINQITYQLLQEGKITHNIRWGGDWNSDTIYSDETFQDLPHFELVGE
jgi:peptidoglycan L-alanyl-D-glutamate endopeptidase CwlK